MHCLIRMNFIILCFFNKLKRAYLMQFLNKIFYYTSYCKKKIIKKSFITVFLICFKFDYIIKSKVFVLKLM